MHSRSFNASYWILFFFFLAILNKGLKVSSECPNACSSHGRCRHHDACECYRNWMGNDCSERMCQFSLAFIDTPKGDIDMSGEITGIDKTVAINSYMNKYGTTEQYGPYETASGKIINNVGHGYRECSNKGLCNRGTGECQCYPGYEGAACQRMACPRDLFGNKCSGHGVCASAKMIAEEDFNEYNLWDRHSSIGCVCTAGFEGPICEERTCKVGYDPLYYEAKSSWRYSNWTILVLTNSSTANIIGNYSIIFTDSYGEEWQTRPIAASARCSEIVSAFESFPNGVIKRNSMKCLQWLNYNSIAVDDEPIKFQPSNPWYGIKTTIHFLEILVI